MCGDMFTSFSETDTIINWLKHDIIWNQRKPYCLLVRQLFANYFKTRPLWGESSGDRRDPLTEGLWWQLFLKWRHDQCKDVIENSKDLIDSIWLTLLLTNRPSLFQKKKEKEKSRCGVSWYSNLSWLMTIFQSSFFTSICQRLGLLYLCYFLNCILASKQSNGFQSKTVRNVLIDIYYRWFTWIWPLLHHIFNFSYHCVLLIQDSKIVYSINIQIFSGLVISLNWRPI